MTMIKFQLKRMKQISCPKCQVFKSRKIPAELFQVYAACIDNSYIGLSFSKKISFQILKYKDQTT